MAKARGAYRGCRPGMVAAAAAGGPSMRTSNIEAVRPIIMIHNTEYAKPNQTVYMAAMIPMTMDKPAASGSAWARSFARLKALIDRRERATGIIRKRKR